MDGISSWFEYLSTRGDLVIETLAQTLTYVVLVTISASIVAIVLGVATRHNPFAKELSLSIASVFYTDRWSRICTKFYCTFPLCAPTNYAKHGRWARFS